MRDNIITFVTTNVGKIATAKRAFEGTNVDILPYNYELIEPRSDDLKEIAKSKVLQAYDKVNKPCIALDSGFFIDELNGFPRAFVNFALDTLGIDGILKQMQNIENRKCHFSECLAYYDGNNIEYFTCDIPGYISNQKIGIDKEQKWSDLWYIFIPEGYTKTLAEMTTEEMQERNSKREPDSFKLFANWYINN